jgi:alcohol dehydrogenase
MTVTDIRQWNYPTRVVFGAGAIARLPKLCAEAGMRKPLFVTDEGLKDAAIARDTLKLLAGAGVAAPV